jgi:hypothetical protein
MGQRQHLPKQYIIPVTMLSCLVDGIWSLVFVVPCPLQLCAGWHLPTSINILLLYPQSENQVFDSYNPLYLHIWHVNKRLGTVPQYSGRYVQSLIVPRTRSYAEKHFAVWVYRECGCNQKRMTWFFMVDNWYHINQIVYKWCFVLIRLYYVWWTMESEFTHSSELWDKR